MLYCHWAVTQRPRELLPNVAKAGFLLHWEAVQDTGGRASITGDAGFFQLQKCGMGDCESHGELMDTASLRVTPHPPSLTSYQHTRK